jgi:hypothetical protein
MKIYEREMWTCPKCGAQFVNKNNSHSCVVIDLDSRFARSAPSVREVFDAYLAAVEEVGPVTVIAQKTRIVFMDRVRFTGATVHKDFIRVPFIFHHRVDSMRFAKIEFLEPSYYLHYLKLYTPDQIDDEVREWIRETWKYGRQDRFR